MLVQCGRQNEVGREEGIRERKRRGKKKRETDLQDLFSQSVGEKGWRDILGRKVEKGTVSYNYPTVVSKTQLGRREWKCEDGRGWEEVWKEGDWNEREEDEKEEDEHFLKSSSLLKNRIQSWFREVERGTAGFLFPPPFFIPQFFASILLDPYPSQSLSSSSFWCLRSSTICSIWLYFFSPSHALVSFTVILPSLPFSSSLSLSSKSSSPCDPSFFRSTFVLRPPSSVSCLLNCQPTHNFRCSFFLCTNRSSSTRDTFKGERKRERERSGWMRKSRKWMRLEGDIWEEDERNRGRRGIKELDETTQRRWRDEAERESEDRERKKFKERVN